MSDIKWAVGMTTVPQRSELRLRTLESLHAAGFSDIVFFFDGKFPGNFVSDDHNRVIRKRPLGPLGNWLLGLQELFIRQPDADRYLMVQDDVVFVKNLRPYLDRAHFNPMCYWNLYCSKSNDEHVGMGCVPGRGFHHSNQKGHGAVALCFDNAGCRKLLQSEAWAEAMTSGTDRAWKFIDANVVMAFTRWGGKELVYWPSLCQHVGEESTCGNVKKDALWTAPSFPGEEWDAMEWLK
jgi:hypothetical protein